MESENITSNLNWIHKQCDGIFTETFWANKGKIQSPDLCPFDIVSSSGITRIDNELKTTFGLFFGDLELHESGKKKPENQEGNIN